MSPTLINIGPLVISSFGVALALALLVSTFAVWKSARDKGLDETKIFDNLIVCSVVAFLGSRVAYVAIHWPVFSEQILRAVVIWQFPGLSASGAIVFGLFAFFFYTWRQKLTTSIMLDAYGRALVWAIFFVSLGVFLDGSVTGKETDLIFGMSAVGVPGLRHPVGLYGMISALFAMMILILLSWQLQARDIKKDGVLGWTSLSLLGVIILILAIVRDDLLYFGGVSLEVALGTVLFVVSLVAVFFTLREISSITKVSKYIRDKTKV